MATIANLSIGLSADSAKLKKDLDKASKQSKQWANKQKKQFKGVADSVKLIGAAVAGISFAQFIRGSIQVSKELKNMSNLTGVSSSELQRVTPSLERAGLSLEKYADIIKDVNDKTHDFLQTGGGPMKDFFETIAPKIGITADAFKGLSGKDALQLYISSLEKAGLSTEQMTFYMEALASDSTMLLPLLRNNAAGMEEFALAANQVLNPETSQSLINIGTSFSTLGKIITNMTLNAIQPLLSFIEKVLDGWRQMITDMPELVYGIEAIAAAVVGLTLAMFANPITLWIAAISALVVGAGWLYYKFKDVAEAVGGAGELFTLMADSAKFEIDRVIAFGEKLKLKMQMVFLRIKDAWTEMLNTMRMSFAKMLDSLAEGPMGSLFGMEGGNEAAAGAANSAATNANMEQFIRLGSALKANSEALNAVNPHLKKMKEAWAGGEPMKVEVENPPGADLTKGGDLGAGAAGGSKKTVDPNSPEGLAKQFVETLKSSFSNALATGDWKSFLDTALDTLTMSIITSFTEGMFKPFEDALGSMVSGMFSGAGGLGGGIGSFVGSIFGFAEGGIVPTTSTSKSYADSVPAMLQPGELVVPKDQVDNFMGGAVGGGGGTYNLNITGDVTRQTRTQVLSMMDDIANGVNRQNKERGSR